EVARRVAVAARLDGRGQVLLPDRDRPGRDRPLGDAVALRRAAAGNPHGRRELGAARAARGARRPVRGPVVALLPALDDAVAARLEPTPGRAAVARRPVAVVALLAQLDDAVPAHGGVRLAREPEAVRVQRARRVLRALDEHARALAAPLPRDADVERRR